jgi:glycosyltransferase involved in cell wall biosynthesis
VSGLDTEAGTVLVLAPDWRRPLEWLPPLAAYVVAAPPEGDTCLVLDARGGELPIEVVGGLVEWACGYLSEGRPFAEVLFVADDVDVPGEPLEGPADLVERLGLSVRALRTEPAEVLLHARWAKGLVDDLQKQIDSALLAAAPLPDLWGAPLVTVRIPTFGSTDLLVERAIPSVLAGDYQNVEVLVCSDGPQPHAREAVEAITDPRVRYIELPERPVYPSRRESFWQVAGTAAVNRLIEEARGELIAPLDHDDAFTRDHIPLLLGTLRHDGADFAYGQAMTEWNTGAWEVLGSAPLRHAQIVHASVMYTRRLAHMRYDPEAWFWNEPGDWNLWRRMQEAGAEIRHLAAPVAVHFREGSSMEGREAAQDVLGAMAADLIGTGARTLLTIASHTRGALGLAGSGPPAAPRRAASSGDGRRLAVLDTHFPLWLSGFRYHEAAELLERRPDTVFFSMARTGESWPRPVYPLSDFGRLADELGITDVYMVFLNLTVSVLGLHGHPGTATCGGIPPDMRVAPVLAERDIRVHTTLYPGGGLVIDTDPDLLRAVGERCATVFTNAGEALAALPDAIRMAGPIATDLYTFQEREPATPFRFVFAAADRPLKGLDTALEALAQLDERFHMHVVGPHQPYVSHVPPERLTYHGPLDPIELRGVYWACDAFISPVRVAGQEGAPGERGLVDGFPTSTACDALASGCALVSSNPRGEHWILEPEEHFLEFPVQDADALAAALRRLEADRALRDRLAERGAARIREVMDVREVVDAKLRAMGLAGVPAD